MDAVLALLGVHLYSPESEGCAVWMRSHEVVTSPPFSVITETPAPGTVVAQDFLIVVPEDVSWRLRAEVYGARQVYRATRSHVQIWTTQYRRCRHCDKETNTPFFLFHPPPTHVAPAASLNRPVRETRYFGSIPKRLPHEEPSPNRYSSRGPRMVQRSVGANEPKLVTGPKVIAIEIMRPAAAMSRAPQLVLGSFSPRRR